MGPSLTGSFEGIALAKPPLVTEWNARKSKSKSPTKQEASTKKEETPSKGMLSSSDRTQDPNYRSPVRRGPR